MAIKKKEVSALMKKLMANSTIKDISVLSESELFNNKDAISTNIPIINVAFSGSPNGGIVSGLTILAGEQACFKTNVALKCVQAYLDKYDDAICIFLDNEGGATPEYLESQGVNPQRVLHVPFLNLEELKFELVRQLKEIERGDKVIFVIDSIGNAASLAELDNALNEKTVADMQRAKTIKSLFRMITPSLVFKDIPCLAICHVYQEMGLFPKAIISGGSGLLYSCNQAFIITKAQEKIDKDVVGWNFTINIEKSRFVRQKSKFPFKVLYGTGICQYSGLLEIALELGRIIKPSNGWYSRVDDDGVVEDKKWRAKDTDTNEFWNELLHSQNFIALIENRYKLSEIPDTDNDVIIDDDSSLDEEIL